MRSESTKQFQGTDNSIYDRVWHATIAHCHYLSIRPVRVKYPSDVTSYNFPWSRCVIRTEGSLQSPAPGCCDGRDGKPSSPLILPPEL